MGIHVESSASIRHEWFDLEYSNGTWSVTRRGEALVLVMWLRRCLGGGSSVSGGLLVVVLHLGVEVLDSLLGTCLTLGATTATPTTACRSTGSSATTLALGSVGSSSGTLGSLRSTGWCSSNLGRVDDDFDLEGLLCDVAIRRRVKLRVQKKR